MKIVITGTSSGIGQYLALRYCDAGHDVWGIARRDQERFTEERIKHGHSFRATQVDISEWSQVEKWSRKVASTWGRVDILICCAGIQGPLGPAMEQSADVWRHSLAVNLNGTFHTVLSLHALLRKAERRAKIVCFSGGGSASPRPYFTPYAVAKAGVVRMVENLAHEWANLPMDINALAPGAVNTRMTDEVIEAGPAVVGAAEHCKAHEQKQRGGTPLQKVGEAMDFLISEASDHITGRLISGLWDPYQNFPDRISEIQKSDIYTMRRIVPQDRSMNLEKPK